MREYSVPARFSVGEHDNIAAVVFEHERDDPSFVIYQRQIDGVWTDVTCAEAASADPFCRTGFDLAGGAGR